MQRLGSLALTGCPGCSVQTAVQMGRSFLSGQKYSAQINLCLLSLWEVIVNYIDCYSYSIICPALWSMHLLGCYISSVCKYPINFYNICGFFMNYMILIIKSCSPGVLQRQNIMQKTSYIIKVQYIIYIMYNNYIFYGSRHDENIFLNSIWYIIWSYTVALRGLKLGGGAKL